MRCPRDGMETQAEEVVDVVAAEDEVAVAVAPRSAAPEARAETKRVVQPKAAPAPVFDIDLSPEPEEPAPIGSSEPGEAGVRLSFGSPEFDAFLGGGSEPGTVYMIAGEPGAGKTTLLVQMCQMFVDANPGSTALYVSGEQNATTIDATAARLGIGASPRFLRVTTNHWQRVVDLVERYDPALLILDALQVLRVDGINRPAGDPAQVRAVAVGLVSEAKRRGMVTFVVVHHTKDASFAGPKLIEHLVDGSFSLLNGAATDQRRLCAPKNRGGDTSEVLRFQMTARGLALVPASSFIEERVDSPGSVVLAATDGAQTTFGLVQALVASAEPDDDDEDDDDEGEDDAPRVRRRRRPRKRRIVTRSVVGLPLQRVAIVCGVLGQHAPVDLSDTELFLQVAGGLDVDDPGADLAIAMAIGSSRMDRRVPVDVCAFGELGLGGEVRSVGRVAQRIRDAARQGMRRILVPGTRRTIEEAGTISGIEVVPVRSVAEVFAWLSEQPKHTRVLLDVDHEGSP